MNFTSRELTAIVFALESFLPLLKGSSNGFSDSENVFCDSGIELEMQWITRTMLDREDFISHIIDVNDWQITTSFSEFLDYTWRAHTVDCFCHFL